MVEYPPPPSATPASNGQESEWARVIRLKKEKRSPLAEGDCFAMAAVERKVQARMKANDEEYRKVLVLQEPLDTVEKVKDMIKAGNNITRSQIYGVEPMVNVNTEQATFTGYRTGEEEVEGKVAEVCTLSCLELHALHMAPQKNFSSHNTFVFYNGEKRVATTVVKRREKPESEC